LQIAMAEEDEQALLAKIIEAIERATGRRPKGWLGPARCPRFESGSRHARTTDDITVSLFSEQG
jgi:hypothetical protein